MKKRVTLILGCLCCMLLSAPSALAHDFFVSICTIDYNAEAQSLEITLKVFTDDLEKVIEVKNQTRLFLGCENESTNANALLKAYVENTFEVQIDDRKAGYEFIGKEVEFDVTWCYLEIKDVSTIHKVLINNQVLMQHFDGQVNITHLTVDQSKKSLFQRKGDEAQTASFP